MCYGDRVCFLCDGQLLALAHKLNLSYQQLALLALATVTSGGLMGLAGFFVWRRGLFRKRYAALCSDDLYDGEEDANTEDGLPMMDPPVDGYARSQRKMTATTTTRTTTRDPSQEEEISLLAEAPEESHYSTRNQHEAVTFRLFAFDPETQQIDFAKVGMPVRFGDPVVVVHAASSRALRFQSRAKGGAVTLSRPPINLNFHKQVRACIEAASAAGANGAAPSGPSVTSSVDDGVRSLASHKQQAGAGTAIETHHKSRQEPRSTPLPSLAELSNYQSTHQQLSHRRSLDLAPFLALLDSDSSDANSLREQTLSQGDDPLAASPSAANNSSNEPSGRANRANNGQVWRQILLPPASSPAPRRHRRSQGSSNFYRSISESYLAFVADLNDTIARQRDRHELRRRQRKLMKDLPNMSFSNPSGKYYVATLHPVKHHSMGVSSNNLGDSRGASGPSGSGSGLLSLTSQEDEYLRWGAPMGIMAAFNHKPCGVAPRGEYYKDSRSYLSTGVGDDSPVNGSTTTLIPLRETGDDLACMARESTRLLARAQRRKVTLKVGTYNVWMLPRKVSAFTGVSPRKNTRARLMAEVLPACDLWVFTECFDHRSRKVLLDKLAETGGYFFSTPTVGHKRLTKGKYLRKLINGGVLVASKYPILSVRIKLFGDASCGADRLADKGVLYCKILKEGLLVHVFATHLQAWNDAPSRAMRKTQLLTIKSFMHSLSIDPENDCVLIVGDLNVDFWLNRSSGEYDEMLELLDVQDPAVVARNEREDSLVEEKSQNPNPAQIGVCVERAKRRAKYSFDKRLNALAADGLSSDGSLELLDYVLVSRGHRQPSRAESWVLPMRAASPWKWRKDTQFNLSDHFPVVSELTFDMAA